MIGAPFFDMALETERLVLRYPRTRDYAVWSELRRQSRSHLEPFEPAWPSDALSREDWRRRIKAWREAQRAGTGHVFFAWTRSDVRLIGGTALNGVRHGSVRSASVGYWLGATHVGQGLMTEALGKLCHWAFEGLNLQRLEAGVLPENAKSLAVLQRVGFREEGFARSFLEIAGQRRDHVTLGLVRADLPS